jgi:peptide/nickel transport system substrate-binding protein/oligopeptide transport system substrate-binding protein
MMRGKGGAARLPFFFIALVLWGGVVKPAWGADSVYRRPLNNDPATLDPARVGDVYSRSVAQQIFDGLVHFDRTLTVTPALAQHWKASRDGLLWTFTLRRNVKFHHGRDVTADDVVYSLARLVDPKTRSAAADLFLNVRGAVDFREGRATHIAGLRAVDRHTVEITLTEASVPFVSVLAVGHAKIVPRDVVEAKGAEAFGMAPVGTGPFRFVSWDRGRQINLAANADYFGGPPRLARLVYRIFPGAPFDAMYEEFQRGQLEDTPPPVRDYRRAVTAAGEGYVKRSLLSVRFYGFNTRMKPFDNQLVRQAVSHAIDREAIIEEPFFGRHVLARGILPPGAQGYNPKVVGYAYDPHRARDLLTRAGYPGGRGLPPMAIWSSVRHQGIVREHDLIRENLNAVGVQAEFQYQTDWPTFSRLLSEHRLPVFQYAWYADIPDPDNFLFKLFHSQSSRNLTGYANPRVDALLVRARNEPDVSRRVELYRRAEQGILDDAPILPVWHYSYERIFQPYVRNVEVSGLGDPYIPFRKVWLAR